MILNDKDYGPELITNIADVDILWKSDCDFELSIIADLFHYHIIDSHCVKRPLHTIEYVPVWVPYEVPSDAIIKWKGYYVGCFHKDNHVCWYHLPQTEEDCLVLTDEIWVLHQRKEHKTICYLLCHEGENGCVERVSMKDTIVILLHTVLAMYHRYTIHAAAVEIEGMSHVFVGESGHGKSTLCTDLTSLGAGYLGDDIIFLYKENEHIMAGGLLFKAKLFPEGIRNHKNYVDVISVHGVPAVLKAPIKAIYYICRSGKRKSRFVRQEPIASVVRLMRASNNIRMQYDAEVWQDICQSTASEIPFYTFLYGAREDVRLQLFNSLSSPK